MTNRRRGPIPRDRPQELLMSMGNAGRSLRSRKYRYAMSLSSRSDCHLALSLQCSLNAVDQKLRIARLHEKIMRPRR